MKSNAFTHNFKLIAWLTFIVYFITTLCGHINFFIAGLWNKNYFPLRSYLIIFNDNQVDFVSKLQKGIYNLAGFKAIINTSFPYKLADDLFFTLISTILVVLFFFGYKLVKANKVQHTEIVKWAILFSFLMALAIPANSSDLYGYIARGAQQSVYHQNPYLETVNSIREYNTKSVFLNFMWPSQVALYGPVFIYLTKTIVFLSNNDLFLSLINFKLFNLTLFLMVVLFISKTKRASDIYLISWNPLILIQGLWNCHNDLFSGTLIFFGLYFLQKKKYFWGTFCFTASAGIKYIALLIIPLIFFFLIRNKAKAKLLLDFVLGFICAALLIFIFSLDYLTTDHTTLLDGMKQVSLGFSFVHKSLIATIFMLIKYFYIWQGIDFDRSLLLSILKYTFYSLFGIFYLFILIKKKINLFSDIALILFVCLSFILVKFHSWYLLNFIFLIPLLEDSLLKRLFIALSMFHTYAITFIDQAKILNFTFLTLLPTLLVLFNRKTKK